MVLRCREFERILIFDRDNLDYDDSEFGSSSTSNLDDSESQAFEETDDKEDSEEKKEEPPEKIINTNKKKFLEILHLLLAIISYDDESKDGKVALYKRVERPSYTDLRGVN